MDDDEEQERDDAPTSPVTDDSEGIGERLLLSNLRTLRRAIKEGWDIPEEARKVVPRRMLKIAAESESARESVAASRVLVAMDRTNRAYGGTPGNPVNLILHQGAPPAVADVGEGEQVVLPNNERMESHE